ncbi:MAG: Na+/H+ antiporter subunit E [Anaerolineae bacterium]
MSRLTYLISVSVFFGLAWIGITARAELGAFAVGFTVSLVVLMLVGSPPHRAKPTNLPRQVLLLVRYIAASFWEITVSSFDVASRILRREMRLKPGVVAIPTFDEHQDDLTAALSAHAITITPGQLCVDYEGNQTMYIHCLDVDTADAAIQQQKTRLATLNAILGRN